MVMVYQASMLLDYESVKLYRMSWMYEHLSVGVYLSQRVFQIGFTLKNFPACNGRC